jgi:hypothetical protein
MKEKRKRRGVADSGQLATVAKVSRCFLSFPCNAMKYSDDEEPLLFTAARRRASNCQGANNNCNHDKDEDDDDVKLIN